LPLTGIFCVLAALQRWRDKRQQVKHPVPVIVVGNISVGGTGKTPLVIWLVERLREAGYTPGVVSRGFGSAGIAGEVFPNANPAEVGDEPLLIVQRTHVPLFVSRDRNQAIRQLLKTPIPNPSQPLERGASPPARGEGSEEYCDIIIADDGLQHYRMGRDVEICVVDGQRRFGNGYCLPSGPLRESVSRLASCDFVVINGETMQMQGNTLLSLAGSESKLLAELAGQTVHVVTGIGNPQRFIATLEQASLRVLPHTYPDHHAFNGEELRFSDGFPVLMTEKDAVKCRQYAAPNCWYLPIRAVLDESFAQALFTRLQGL
jgi:tetraacyldisaccharide 4'-kinase